MKDNSGFNVGVRFCSNCEYNLKCTECSLGEKYERLLAKHDRVLGEAGMLKKELDGLRALVKEKEIQIERLKKVIEEENQNLTLRTKQSYKDGMKDLAYRLCRDRYSNDPVLIAVNSELRMANLEE